MHLVENLDITRRVVPIIIVAYGLAVKGEAEFVRQDDERCGVHVRSSKRHGVAP